LVAEATTMSLPESRSTRLASTLGSNRIGSSNATSSSTVWPVASGSLPGVAPRTSVPKYCLEKPGTSFFIE
jgi:hypothetical protein